MNLDNLNKWLTLLANIGVLGGIVFLGMEIRQNTETIRLAEVQANRLNSIELFRETSESPYIPPIIIKRRAGEELTPEESYRYSNYLSGRFANAFYNWIQRELELAEGYLPSDEVMMPNLITTPGAIDWWGNVGRIYPEGFREYVENWIEITTE